MTGTEAWRIWAYRGLFLALAFLLIGYRLLPLNAGAPGLLPPPDLLLALTFAWLLRQPEILPIGLIVIVFVLADFLLQRPPGLFTALVLLASEALKARRMDMAESNFLLEWAAVTIAIFAILIGERMGLWLLAAPQTTLGLTLMHGLVTVAIYPLVVLLSHSLFGLRRLSSAEAES